MAFLVSAVLVITLRRVVICQITLLQTTGRFDLITFINHCIYSNYQYGVCAGSIWPLLTGVSIKMPVEGVKQPLNSTDYCQQNYTIVN